MQINKMELEAQLVSLLPERETLFFNTWKGNFSNIEFVQTSTAVNVGLLNDGGAFAINEALVSVAQING